MTDWSSAQLKAAKTARWAVTMAKVRIRRSIARTKWQLVTFNGPRGSESVGIVDMLAVRKNHQLGSNGLKRGDLLEVVLIQVKGGSAPFPTADEVKRLRMVAQFYKAKAVMLGQWKRGVQVEFFRLRSASRKSIARRRDHWEPLESLTEVFH